MAEAGLLVLVVGPSGAGKDTLLDCARSLLDDEAAVVFPRREITRAQDAGGEDHVEVSRETFDLRDASGAYALSWSAHGLGYGVPAAIAGDIAAGRRVVVNVSRGVVEAARARFAKVRVVTITANASILAQRLARRGRETQAEIEARLSRADAVEVAGDDVVEVRNEGEVVAGVAQLLDAIRR
ncbi:phosphonate metabolism protein/1,5-bisphosphokinase (PRPP-forming) PhnN [Phenylobacterium sp. LH3H17]|uniref:phosphonate metabolism protein/1,5-bisphosphokinase (PRPP-forming) PhnN n=1 Tax=Phenylobacterium sp. LH3H17 TaxID=2903901 RepID=UPI0020C9E032|nr:phosphonate metabolism protein/1,5-bisphosphokinase (PRPP-forming) PhnN [Phenylobacterium sp. LH3H17]UTP38491.1 phosphonate metabolism protein/1,5-bisphosphokinase (PRPP-forming) PhnN [Phenylobacterium sp. LH3H17]